MSTAAPPIADAPSAAHAPRTRQRNDGRSNSPAKQIGIGVPTRPQKCVQSKGWDCPRSAPHVRPAWRAFIRRGREGVDRDLHHGAVELLGLSTLSATRTAGILCHRVDRGPLPNSHASFCRIAAVPAELGSEELRARTTSASQSRAAQFGMYSPYGGLPTEAHGGTGTRSRRSERVRRIQVTRGRRC
jgi:hypothetical protein